MARNKRRGAKHKDKDLRWPKKDKLAEAIDVVHRFQQMCKLQLDLGYWVTMDFPTKHHINKILSVQYVDHEMLKKVYGEKLTERALQMVPVCRNFISFTKDVENEKPEIKNQADAS